MNAYWSKQLFTGKGTPPKEIVSETDILNSVSENLDVIGYVTNELVDESVRVITVIKGETK